MAERHCLPADIGSLTLPQLLCMASEKPPAQGKTIRSYAEYQEYIRAEEAAWSDKPQ